MEKDDDAVDNESSGGRPSTKEGLVLLPRRNKDDDGPAGQLLEGARDAFADDSELVESDGDGAVVGEQQAPGAGVPLRADGAVRRRGSPRGDETVFADPSDSSDTDGAGDHGEESGESDSSVEAEPARPAKSRGKKRMSRSNKNREATLTDATEKLGELRKEGIEVFNVRVQRRTPNGKWVTLGGDFNGMIWKTDDILKGDLAEYIRERVGGQTYVAWFRDPEDITHVYFKLELNLPGRAYDPGQIRSGVDASTAQPQPQMMNPSMAAMGFTPLGGPQQMAMPAGPQTVSVHGVQVPVAAFQQQLPVPRVDAQGKLMPPPPNQLPAHIARGGYPVEMQWQMYFESLKDKGTIQDGQQNMHWAMTFDQRSQQKDAEIARLQEQLAAKERESSQAMASMRDSFSKEIDQLRRDLDKKNDEAREERHQAELRMLRAEMQASAKPPEKPPVDFVGTATALAPIATALISAFVSRAQSDRQMQIEMAKLQQSASDSQTKQLTTLLAKPKDDPLEKIVPLLTAVAPAALAAIQEFVNQPLKAMEAKNDTNIMLMKMVSDTLVSQAQAQGETPWFQPLLAEMAENLPQLGMVLGSVAERISARKEMAAARPLPQSVQAEQRSAPPPPQASNGTPVHPVLTDGVLARFASESPAHRQAAEEVKTIYTLMSPSYGFHTHPWRMLLLNAHMLGDVRQLGQMFASHIMHCQQFGTLPEVLSNVFEEPEKALGPVMKGLPVAKREPDYVRVLLQEICIVLDAIKQAGGSMVAYEDEDDEEEYENEEDGTGEDTGDLGDLGASPAAIHVAPAVHEEPEAAPSNGQIETINGYEEEEESLGSPATQA